MQVAAPERAHGPQRHGQVERELEEGEEREEVGDLGGRREEELVVVRGYVILA